MTENRNLRIVYYTLVFSIWAILIIWMITDVTHQSIGGAPRLVGLFLLAMSVMALAFLSDKKWRRGVW